MTVTKNYLFGYCIAVIVNYALFCKVKSTKKNCKISDKQANIIP